MRFAFLPQVSKFLNCIAIHQFGLDEYIWETLHFHLLPTKLHLIFPIDASNDEPIYVKEF